MIKSIDKTNKNLNKTQVGDTMAYFVEAAAFCRVGEAWNRNIWDPKNNPTGYHALYYRTDNTDCKAVLHMLDGTLELLPGRIYFIPAYSVLFSEIHGEMEKYYIHFQSDFIDFGLYRHLFDRCFVPDDSMTRSLFDCIVENHSVKTPAAERKISGAMEILLADLLENLAVQPRDVNKFKPVLEYIELHYRENISIKQLAKMMSINPVYFSNAFKAAFHVSPKQYILGKRLFESQLLLTRTNLSVAQIAEQVGFENENYFSEFFSQKIGISALKFRRNAQK